MADLREILSQAAAAMAEALGGLTNETVSAEMADLTGGAAAEMAAGISEAGVAIPLTASGPLAGELLLWLPETSAKVIAGALAGEEATPEALTDLHLSALGEMGKLAAEALTTALGTAVAGAQVAAGEPGKADVAGVPALLAGLGAEVNQGALNLTLKGTQVAVRFYLGAALAAAVSTASATPAAAEGAAAAAGGGFTPGLGSPQTQEGGPAEVKPVALTEAEPGQVLDMKTGLELLRDVNVKITVELGRTNKYVREVLTFAPGSIIELDKREGEPVDVYVNDMLFARGEVVTIDESFAVRITEIMSKDQRYGGLQQIAK